MSGACFHGSNYFINCQIMGNLNPNPFSICHNQVACNLPYCHSKLRQASLRLYKTGTFCIACSGGLRLRLVCTATLYVAGGRWFCLCCSQWACGRSPQGATRCIFLACCKIAFNATTVGAVTSGVCCSSIDLFSFGAAICSHSDYGDDGHCQHFFHSIYLQLR